MNGKMILFLTPAKLPVVRSSRNCKYLSDWIGWMEQEMKGITAPYLCFCTYEVMELLIFIECV